MEEMIKLKRNRTTSYTVNYPTMSGGKPKTFKWAGSKGKQTSIVNVPMEVFDWLTLNTACFKNAELVVVEDSDSAKEAVDMIPDVEDYKANAHSKEDIITLLKGNFPKMKKELKTITSSSEKRFVLDVADEIRDELINSKTDFLEEWVITSDSTEEG